MTVLKEDEKNLIEALNKLGPCLSSVLAAALSENEGLSPPAARKRIERARRNNEVLSVDGIRFSHNEAFLYLPNHVESKQLTKALFKALESSKSAFRFPLFGVKARGGIVPKDMFHTVSGFPVVSRAKRINSETALRHLEKAELLTVSDFTVELAFDFHAQNVSYKRYKSRIYAENLFLTAFSEWLRLQGLVSAEKFSVRMDETAPQFGFFQWDFVGPCYTLPISTKEPKNLGPGFVVADVILGRVLSANDIQAFLHKTTSARQQKNNRPFMAFLIADWFEKDALYAGRREGLIFTTPKNLFGKPMAEFLDDFTQAFENKESFVKAEPDYLLKLMRNLQTLGHLRDLVEKGKEFLFTLIVGYCYAKQLNRTPDYDFSLGISPQIDVDVFIEGVGRKGNILCQCIWHPEPKTIDAQELDLWIHLLPNSFETLRNSLYKSTTIVLCTNSALSPSAEKRLAEASRRYDIAWLDAKNLPAFVSSFDEQLAEKMGEILFRPLKNKDHPELVQDDPNPSDHHNKKEGH